MGVTFCDVCGFGAEGALACALCGSDLSGPKPKVSSQIGWVDAPTELGGRALAADRQVVHAPGRIFAGRYKILGSIGRGAMGLVLKVEDLQTQRTVALKLMLSPAADPGLLARFRREVKIASELEHPNALAVYDAGLVESSCYYTMELIDGGSVAELIKKGPVPFETIDRLAVQLVSVVGAAHAKGVVHRDIKPSNLLLTKDGVLKLVDFGIAKLHQAGDQTDLTQTGLMTGSPYYFAPEQIRDSKHVDGRADLYSIGVVLFELLTGKPPFEGNTTMAIAVKHLNEPAPSVAAGRTGVPPALAKIVARLLEKDPMARFQTAGELLEALQSVGEQSARERLPNGDMLVVHRPGARYPVELFTRDPKGRFEVGQRVALDGHFYKLAEAVESRPPYALTLRFELLTDVGAIGRLVDLRATLSTPPPEGLFARLSKKLKR